MTAVDERAALAHMVIGPQRREKIIAQEADGIALKHGMPLGRARNYAMSCFETADTETIIRVGQVWARDHDGQKIPSDDLVKMLGGEPEKTYTVHGFDCDMVDVGGGHFVNVMLFRGLWLVAWPESFTLDDESPQPPSEPVAEDDEAQPLEEGGFDPRSLWTLAYRGSDWNGGIPTPYLPLLGDHYTAVNIIKPEYDPAYSNRLDVPAYLAEHLADYRAGWPDWRAQSSDDWIDYFNELDGGCECDVAVAAYLGSWLWQRLRSDVVTEHGGTVDDYTCTFGWSPGMADVVLEVAPYADPEWEIPPDHPLALTEGQEPLFEEAADA